jgi:hypothetical protein
VNRSINPTCIESHGQRVYDYFEFYDRSVLSSSHGFMFRALHLVFFVVIWTQQLSQKFYHIRILHLPGIRVPPLSFLSTGQLNSFRRSISKSWNPVSKRGSQLLKIFLETKQCVVLNTFTVSLQMLYINCARHMDSPTSYICLLSAWVVLSVAAETQKSEFFLQKPELYDTACAAYQLPTFKRYKRRSWNVWRFSEYK